MKSMKVLRMALLILLTGAVAAAWGQAGPPLDQEKQYYGATEQSYIVYYTDSDIDGFHDPGEALFFTPGGTAWAYDMSCWIATASNMIQHTGAANPYLGYLQAGAAQSPATSPWGAVITCDGGGNQMTFDDGGWPDWALTQAGMNQLPPIKTSDEFGVGSWTMNPITWCKVRLNGNLPVGLTLWYGSVKRGMLPGRVDLSGDGFYHAITLWEINEGAGTVTITDSDDQVVGSRVLNFSFTGNDWIIYNLYPGKDVHVNYAVATASSEIPTLSEWGLILLGLTLIGVMTWMMLRRRQTSPAI